MGTLNDVEIVDEAVVEVEEETLLVLVELELPTVEAANSSTRFWSPALTHRLPVVSKAIPSFP